MIRRPSRVTTRVGQAGHTATVAAAAMVVALSLMWCIAVMGHLYCLRRGLDACCADD